MRACPRVCVCACACVHACVYMHNCQFYNQIKVVKEICQQIKQSVESLFCCHPKNPAVVQRMMKNKAAAGDEKLSSNSRSDEKLSSSSRSDEKLSSGSGKK